MCPHEPANRHRDNRGMAKTGRDTGKQARPSGRSKSASRRTHPQWYCASRDAEQRSRLHPRTSPQDGERLGFVYVMQDATGLTKIGYSEDVAHRLLAIQQPIASGPGQRPIRLVSAIGMPWQIARKAEKLAHQRLDAYRVYERGCISEWFRVTPQRAGCVLGVALRRAWQEFGPRNVETTNET